MERSSSMPTWPGARAQALTAPELPHKASARLAGRSLAENGVSPIRDTAPRDGAPTDIVQIPAPAGEAISPRDAARSLASFRLKARAGDEPQRSAAAPAQTAPPTDESAPAAASPDSSAPAAGEADAAP